ncbi:MAG: hypothetical protein ABMA01_11560 [Chthoniobacteraceae bacterium]
MPDDFDRDHSVQGATMEFLRRASHLPSIAAASHPLAVDLAMYDRNQVVTVAAALLTEPSLQTHTLRLEALLHLALVHCRGDSATSRAIVARWLNDYLGKADLRPAEDPPEDAFVTNVVTAEGNRRIFQGNWIGNDFWLQEILDCVGTMPKTGPYARLRRELDALLLLSETLAARCGLPRGTLGGGNPQKDIAVPDDELLSARARAVVFTGEDLRQLGISAESLAPFVLPDEKHAELAAATLGQSLLERHPTCRVRGGWLLALPSAVTNAAIRHVLRFLQQDRQLDGLKMMLRIKQGDRTFNEALGTMKVKAAATELPKRPATLTCCDVIVDKFDDDKLALIVLLHDDLEAVLRDGMASCREFEPATMRALNAYLRECILKVSLNQPGFAGGLLIVVMGGIGRGFHLLLEDMMPGWELLVFSLSDFSSLGWVERISLLRLWKLIRERRRLLEGGVQIFNGNGDFNLFAHWRQWGYRLIPPQVPFPAENLAFGVTPSAVAPLRQALRGGYDVHGIAYGERWMEVKRMAMRSFFDDSEQRPIYASSERARDGHLCGVVETAKRGWWMESQPDRSRKVSADIHFRVWDGLLNWMGRFAFVLEEELPRLPPGSIHVFLEIEGIETWTELQMPNVPDADVQLPKVGGDPAKRVVWLKVPASFLQTVQRAVNDGERELLMAICVGAATIAGQRITRHRAKEIVARVMPNTEARFFHILPAGEFRIHARLEGRVQPRFICEEDQATSRLGIVRGFWPSAEPPADAKAAGEFFREAVDFIWRRIRGRLQALDCRSTIVRSLRNIEALAVDEDQWHISAQALLAWHEDAETVKKRALHRESERSIAAIASRVLAEMTVCTCPTTGGRVCSREDFDALLAEIELLIVTAHISDAVRSGFASPRVELTASGEFLSDMTFLREVVSPYLGGHFNDGFISSAERYAEHFERKTTPTDGPEIPEPFAAAFRAEFGLTPLQVIEAKAALGDLAYKAKAVVMSVKESEVISCLAKECGLTPDESRRFLSEFSLTRRPRWDDPKPAPFRSRDWYPWRFRRRLSLYSRPLVRVDDAADATIIFAPGLMDEGFRYVMMSAYTGDFPNDFFLSAEMRAWIGAANNERGHRFNREMAAEVEKLGWRAEASAQMSRFGAPEGLGDVDVLAWNATLRIVLVIECKRLQMARTIGEIVEQLKRFKGEAEDDLGVHMRRFHWLQQNPRSLEALIGFPATGDNLKVMLLTNTTIPSRYLQDTPIAREAVLTAAGLAECIQSLTAV